MEAAKYLRTYCFGHEGKVVTQDNIGTNKNIKTNQSQFLL